MKKLLLLGMLSFSIASQAMFGQTKYCEDADIPLSNYQSSAEADWSNEDEPYYVGYNQEIVYQNHARYIISNGVANSSLDYIYPGSTFNIDALFNNSITFSANGEATFYIYCAHMTQWQYQGSYTGWVKLNDDYLSTGVAFIVKKKPTMYSVTSDNLSACSNVGLTIGLQSSEAGVNYQLSTGTIMAGNGSAISFGKQYSAGNYSVTAVKTSTSCSANMVGDYNVYPNPTVYGISSTGTAPYGTNSGTTIGLNASQTGVNYQLYNGAAASGSLVSGTGSAISFGTRAVAGTYTVTATNASTSCPSSMSGSVTIYTSPTIYNITATGSVPYCTSTGATIGLSGSQTSVSYQLYNGVAADGPALAGTGAALSFGAKILSGNYTVIATNANNCTSNMTGSITINTTPTVTLPDFTPVCLNTPAFALSGGAPVLGTYSGTGVSGNNFNPSVAGVSTPTITYTYTSNGCTASASKTLTVKSVPSITTSAIPSVCINGSAVSLAPYFSATPSGGSATYVWPNGTGSTLNPTVAGMGNNKIINYNYTGTNGCISSATNTINILDVPAVTLDNLPPVCKTSNAITLTGGLPGGGAYSGTGVSNGTFNPNGLNAGDHTITYTYSNGACSNLANAIITILDRDKPATPALDYHTIMCRNTSQTLQITNQLSNTIQWYDADNNLLGISIATYPVNDLTQDLIMKVRFSDGTCVSDLKSVTVYVDKVKADFSLSSASVKQGSTAAVMNLSTDASTYKWVMSGDAGVEQTLAAATPTFNFNILGTKNIKLVATSQNNCKDSITRTGIITVTASGQSGIANSKASDVKVYPNPANNVVNIDLTGQHADVSIAIYNTVGAKLTEKQIKNANGIEVINISWLSSGTYLMVVNSHNSSITFKLKKE